MESFDNNTEIYCVNSSDTVKKETLWDTTVAKAKAKVKAIKDFFIDGVGFTSHDDAKYEIHKTIIRVTKDSRKYHLCFAIDCSSDCYENWVTQYPL